MPDFAEGAGDTVRPVTGRVLETAHDGDHGFNACRTPWRLWLDALWRRLAASRVDPGDYFGGTIQLQVMIIVSGNYPASD